MRIKTVFSSTNSDRGETQFIWSATHLKLGRGQISNNSLIFLFNELRKPVYIAHPRFSVKCAMYRGAKTAFCLSWSIKKCAM